jgi:sulfite reductase (NADPH) flavoprotein alpha-component
LNSQQPGILNPEQWNLITQAIAPLSREQLNWVSGYMAGLASASSPVSAAPNVTAVAEKPALSFTVMFGSQTGNAKGIAQSLHKQLTDTGVPSVLVSMADYKPRQIKNETHLALVVSTHGEGDAPDDAIEFHEFLASKKAPKLTGLNYSVLGLGDSSYEYFCQTGKDFDNRLASLGATALAERVDCDVDYEAAVNDWSAKLVDVAKQSLVSQSADVVPIASAVKPNISEYTKQNPFQAPLLLAQKITGRNSIKDIQHIELALEGSGLSYQAGDALGVWFKNDPLMVDEILALVKVDPDIIIENKNNSLTVRQALIENLELTVSYPGFVKAYAAATESAALNELLSEPSALRAFLADRQIIDIVRQYPSELAAQSLVNALRPLTPRLYSIASSQAEVEDEVHLTVAHVDYAYSGKRHQGGASGFLSSRLEEGQEVGVYIEKK